MKGLLSKAPMQMEVVDEEIREPGRGHVLIRIDRFNLCGSNLILTKEMIRNKKERTPIL